MSIVLKDVVNSLATVKTVCDFLWLPKQACAVFLSSLTTCVPLTRRLPDYAVTYYEWISFREWFLNAMLYEGSLCANAVQRLIPLQCFIHTVHKA